MTVAKLTQSKRAVLVVDDSGNVYIVPLSAMRGLLDGRLGVVKFNRLPYSLPVERFGVSELWDSDGTKKKYEDMGDNQTVIDTQVQRKKEEYRIFDDVVIE